MQRIDRAKIERLEDQPILEAIFAHGRIQQGREFDRIDVGVLGYLGFGEEKRFAVLEGAQYFAQFRNAGARHRDMACPSHIAGRTPDPQSSFCVAAKLSSRTGATTGASPDLQKSGLMVPS